MDTFQLMCSEQDLKDIGLQMGPRKKLLGFLNEEKNKKVSMHECNFIRISSSYFHLFCHQPWETNCKILILFCLQMYLKETFLKQIMQLCLTFCHQYWNDLNLKYC